MEVRPYPYSAHVAPRSGVPVLTENGIWNIIYALAEEKS